MGLSWTCGRSRRRWARYCLLQSRAASSGARAEGPPLYSDEEHAALPRASPLATSVVCRRASYSTGQLQGDAGTSEPESSILRESLPAPRLSCPAVLHLVVPTGSETCSFIRRCGRRQGCAGGPPTAAIRSAEHTIASITLNLGRDRLHAFRGRGTAREWHHAPRWRGLLDPSRFVSCSGGVYSPSMARLSLVSSRQLPRPWPGRLRDAHRRSLLGV
ncbi:hypothetical protein C8J57DRAFT_149182 [Mycena rebaudengoi]|nr:hypothetical protein C8J57DRAFT_149182 [Mycena rebaudengoi]